MLRLNDSVSHNEKESDQALKIADISHSPSGAASSASIATQKKRKPIKLLRAADLLLKKTSQLSQAASSSSSSPTLSDDFKHGGHSGIQNKISLTSYAAISALMEQKARLYETGGDPAKMELEQKFPIKLVHSNDTEALADSKDSNCIHSVVEKTNATHFLDLTKLSSAHTLNISRYLKYRLPQIIAELANTLDVFIWVGTRADMQSYLKANGIQYLAQIHAQNMRKFFLAKNADGKPIFWISGFPSVSNLRHLLLQLYYAGVDIYKIDVLGNLATTKSAACHMLTRILQQIIDPKADEHILFIGSRSSTMKVFSPISLTVTPHKISGSFEFNDLCMIDKSGKKIQVFVLKLPQGEAAYDATRAFIQCGIQKIVMTGAGGALSAKGAIGDYVLINDAEYQGKVIHLDEDTLVPINDCQYVAPAWTRNVTVDSPLDETVNWYNENKQHGCVDVETFHVFKAISEAKNLKVIAGFFISDVVNKIPFFELLSGSSVGKNIGNFSLMALSLMSSIELSPKVEKSANIRLR